MHTGSLPVGSSALRRPSFSHPAHKIFPVHFPAKKLMQGWTVLSSRRRKDGGTTARSRKEAKLCSFQGGRRRGRGANLGESTAKNNNNVSMRHRFQRQGILEIHSPRFCETLFLSAVLSMLCTARRVSFCYILYASVAY
jgi:hypothetical protein